MDTNTNLKKKYRKIGLYWLLIPILSLFAIVAIWGFVAFLRASLGVEGGTVVTIINLLIPILIILDILLFLAGIPIGIVYLNMASEIKKKANEKPQ